MVRFRRRWRDLSEQYKVDALKMDLTLDPSQVERLLSFVDFHLRRDGCDHTHRFTEEWARQESVDWHDLLDILEETGSHCDCEVVMNLPEGIGLQLPASRVIPDRGNPWLLPPGFDCEKAAVFSKIIVCQAELGRNTYATDGEVLVPAPLGAKPRSRVRKSVNYFIGCQSGLPSEVGVIRECSEISALDFARGVAESGFPELAEFTYREAGFVLSRVRTLKSSAPVGTDFADRVDIGSRHRELTVHRVIMKQ